MAKDDARYTGDFFTSYTNTRMKLHRHCVPLNNEPDKIAEVYGYPRESVDRIFRELETDLEQGAEYIEQRFAEQIREKLTPLAMPLVFIGDQLTSEYLSYCNILRKALSGCPGISLHVAGNSGDTSNQSLQYVYNLAVAMEPKVTSILVGINDVFCSRDAYHKTVSSRKEYQDNIDYLTKVMLHNGSRVILNTLPGVQEEEAEAAYAHMNWTISNAEIRRRNEDIREIARRNHCALNDLEKSLAEFDKPVNLEKNGVLLTKEAQLYIAENFMEILLQQL